MTPQDMERPAGLTPGDEGRAREIAAWALAACAADEVECVLLGEDSALTRFASNHIHQNVRERNTEVRVRAVVAGRIGAASTNDLTKPGVERAARRAADLARLSPVVEAWPGLPDPMTAPPMPAPDEATVAATPEDRAGRVGVICRLAADHDGEAAGALSTAHQTVAVANSKGMWAFGDRSRARWVAVVLSGSGSGYSQWVGSRLADLDHEALAAEAVDKAVGSRDPVDVEAGDYPVVLESYAVGTLVGFLGMLGFSGQAVVEGRSFMARRFGERVTGGAITITDDCQHPLTLPMSFDYEGVPRQRVVCVEAGVARNAVWDRTSAARFDGGQTSTGHALPAPNSMGPVPGHLVLSPGDADAAALAAPVERGLYVTRFNYVRPVMPMQTVITGLTRDGTFLIEDGRIAQPVKNLRFTQSILEALDTVEAVGSELRPVGESIGSMAVPALRLGRFRFTGTTSY